MKINSVNGLKIMLIGAYFVATPVSAAITSLVDNFDSESRVLNYTSFSHWDVTNGTVDVVGSGNWSIDCVGGSGACVDLDGSSRNAGDLVSKELFAEGTYDFQFKISGNQRGGSRPDAVTVSLGDFSEYFSLSHDDPFMLVSRTVTVGTGGAKLSFSAAGGDNQGLMLDDVSVTQTPVPAAIWLFGSALLGLAGLRRRNVSLAAS